MTDRIILQAVEAAQFELALYLTPGHRSPEATLERLMLILNNHVLCRAMDEIGKPGNVVPLRLVQPVQRDDPGYVPPSLRDGSA